MSTSDKLDMRQWGDRFSYKTSTGDAHCYVRVHRCVVICTEAPDNDGMSITNAAEIVARSVCYTYHIPIDRLVWIEHYTCDTLGIGETFDRVEFTITSGYKGYEFSNPKWSTLSKDEALDMLGLPMV